MNSQIQAALKKEKPDEFLRALMAAIPYSKPLDFQKLNADERLIVCCNCFAWEMFSGGYICVLEHLPEWTSEIMKSLRRIRAVPYSDRFAKVVRLARANHLMPFSDSDWSDYLARHPKFELETVRDYERVVDVVARCLRSHLKDSVLPRFRYTPKKRR